MSEEGREMFFMIGVIEGAGESMEREVHGKFVSMKGVAIKVIAEVCEVVVEKPELFCWSSLPGEKGRGERGR